MLNPLEQLSTMQELDQDALGKIFPQGDLEIPTFNDRSYFFRVVGPEHAENLQKMIFWVSFLDAFSKMFQTLPIANKDECKEFGLWIDSETNELTAITIDGKHYHLYEKTNVVIGGNSYRHLNAYANMRVQDIFAEKIFSMKRSLMQKFFEIDDMYHHTQINLSIYHSFMKLVKSEPELSSRLEKTPEYMEFLFMEAVNTIVFLNKIFTYERILEIRHEVLSTLVAELQEICLELDS